MELVEEYEDLQGHDIEVWKCGCGREHQIYAGGEVACCPCECGDLDYEQENLIHEGGRDER